MPPNSLPAEAVEVLRAERDAARSALVAMEGEMRRLRVERDLLRAQPRAAKHKLFAARSEARGSEQRDLFRNEAEALGASATPAREDAADGVEVAAHRCVKRGRKPLDPDLPRERVACGRR